MVEHEDAADDAVLALIRHAVDSGGFAVGPFAEQERPAWADELIRQFNDADEKRCCPHFRAGASPGYWMPLAPDLVACQQCVGQLVSSIESRLGHTLAEEPSRCTICDAQGPVRGVSIAWGRFLLRGMLCAKCQADGVPRDGSHSEEADVDVPVSLTTLGIPAIRIDSAHLSQTEVRGDFDELGWQMLARAGRLCQLLVERAGRRPDGTPVGLTLDEAVVGGLLVRMGKLARAIFDSTQADESEAHSPLSRCLGETAITLRWLVWKSDPVSYRRFRADSFARWRTWLQRAAASSEDETAKQLRQGIEKHIAAELEAAGLTWDEVPARSNSWGPDVRRRFEDLDQYWLYEALFVSHSNYVHPTWHELRAFHLATHDGDLRLDSTYAGIAPIAAFVLSRLVAEACLDALSVLPHSLDEEAFTDAVRHTVRASQHLSSLFNDFAGRGGLDDDLRKHYAPS